MGFRHAAGAFVLSGLCLLTVACLDYFGPGTVAAVVIQEPEREIALEAPGQVFLVTFAIRNSGDRPARVVGLAYC